MGQSNWFWPRILAQFVDENEHSGGFTNGELLHQARADRHPLFYINRLDAHEIFQEQGRLISAK
jgi:hypothetical protein